MADALDILGYEVLAGGLESLGSDAEQRVILTLNPHSYVVAKEDPGFAAALRSADCLLPDGSGIVLAARILHGAAIDKISGSDLHRFLLARLNRTGGRAFYLGSTNEVLEQIRERVGREYPQVEVVTLSPPFKAEFSEEENAEMITRINAARPDVLFVGMTAPKQEKWIATHKHRIDTRSLVAIGAVFDFYTGNIKRPSEFWLKLHLEWLVRLLGEPRRLWRRTLVSAPLFLLDVLRRRLSTTSS